MSKNGCFRSCTNLEALHILQGIPYIQYFPCTSKTWTYVNVFVRIRSCFGRTPAFMTGAPKFWIFRGQKIPGTNGAQARNSKFWTYMNVFIGARSDFERARMCASCTSKPWTLASQIRNKDDSTFGFPFSCSCLSREIRDENFISSCYVFTKASSELTLISILFVILRYERLESFNFNKNYGWSVYWSCIVCFMDPTLKNGRVANNAKQNLYIHLLRPKVWSNGCAQFFTFRKWTFMNVYVHERSKFWMYMKQNGCARKAQSGPVLETPKTSNIWMFSANVQLLVQLQIACNASTDVQLRKHPIFGCFQRTCNSFYNSKLRATPARMCNSVNIQFSDVFGERATLTTLEIWMYFRSIDVQFWRLFLVTSGVDDTRTVKAYKNHKNYY